MLTLRLNCSPRRCNTSGTLSEDAAKNPLHDAYTEMRPVRILEVFPQKPVVNHPS
jgi:hypothetical protein